MFKLLILQGLHNLSDERLQYQASDRLSFMRFLGMNWRAMYRMLALYGRFVKHSKNTNSSKRCSNA